ncbi:MAG: hypothetical protein J5I90_19390 [Caldilineales bacterium]|nr:hypothetical protein [Caldilineales bacterium]
MNLKRLSGPLKVGLVAALVGLILAIVGIARGAVPLNFTSILLALLISGVSWGVVAWAIATAAADVDQDLAEGDDIGDSVLDT